MVTLRVSESVALDMLSILEVKQAHGLNVSDEMKLIRQDLTLLDLEKIQQTREYLDLKNANLLVWETVEWARKDRVDASVVFEANLGRFFAKRRLQEAFWPETPLLERKSKLECTCST